MGVNPSVLKWIQDAVNLLLERLDTLIERLDDLIEELEKKPR